MEQISYAFIYLIWLLLTIMWLTFIFMQKLLERDKPLVFNINSIKKLECVVHYLFGHTSPHSSVSQTTIDDRLDDFVNDIERNFVEKWYSCISNDSSFPTEVKTLLDLTVRRFLQILPNVDSKQCFYGLLIIYLKHLKEYRRAVKRSTKSLKSIEDIYRYTYNQDVTQKLTATFLRQFINWELWNSLPCQTLSLILSKQLTAHILNYVSTPAFLNYKLIEYGASNETKNKMNFIKFCSIVTEKEILNVVEMEKPLFLPLEKDETSQTPKKLKKRKVGEELGEKRPIRSANQIETEVKIYEPKSTNQTWRNSSDLDSVSLGQDTLDLEEPQDAQIQELIFKKLWKDSEDMLSEEKVWDSPEDEEELNLSPGSNLQNAANIITNTIGNATVNTMKELQQSTVNSVVKPVSQATSTAMHKIGDLQDEAAEMMEGILDYGMARLRKGLCLTGLQENLNEFAQKAKHEFQRQDARNEIEIDTKKLNDQIELKDEDSVWMNPMIHFEPAEILQSPDPEYEETPDLSTAITKLRTLLQQKSESCVTTPSLSPMPQEDGFKSATITPNESDYIKTDGPVPTLYKFCARTATDVFQNTLNTIKTALPGGANGPAHEPYDVELLEADPTSDDFQSRMKKLLAERSAFCIVDTAYEAIQSFEMREAPEKTFQHFDDETDEDLCVPITHALLDIFCELTSDVSTYATRETIIKSLMIIFGKYTEEFLINEAERFWNKLKNYIGKLPTYSSQEVLQLSVEEIAQACSDAIPNYVNILLGTDVVQGALRLFISSLQSQRINRDVFTQFFELFVSQVVSACGQISPAYSA